MVSLRTLLTTLLMAQVLNLSLCLPVLVGAGRDGVKASAPADTIDSFTELMAEQLAEDCPVETAAEEPEGDHTGGVPLLKFLVHGWQLTVPGHAEATTERPIDRTGTVVGGSLPTHQPPEGAATVRR